MVYFPFTNRNFLKKTQIFKKIFESTAHFECQAKSEGLIVWVWIRLYCHPPPKKKNNINFLKVKVTHANKLNVYPTVYFLHLNRVCSLGLVSVKQSCLNFFVSIIFRLNDPVKIAITWCCLKLNSKESRPTFHSCFLALYSWDGTEQLGGVLRNI